MIRFSLENTDSKLKKILGCQYFFALLENNDSSYVM
jgi:hypothetical protein